ncbi:MAG: OmpA family protein [Verrucomicrobiales bacterium]|nr:OmpA family protein [Verrucomicrobiales bacterium]
MATSTRTHEWKPAQTSTFRSREDWSLRWWIIFALLLSVVFHGILVVGFETLGGAFSKSRPVEPEPHRVRINPDLLKQQQAVQEIPQQLTPGVEPDIKAFQPDLDDFDKVQMLPDNQEIDLTPQVTEMKNLVRAEVAAQGEGAAPKLDLARMLGPETSSVKSLAQEMAAVRREVLTAPVSEKQMLLDASALEGENDGEAMNVDLLGEAKAQGQGTDAAGVEVEGFSSLDQLLSQGGGRLGGSTDPILMPTDLLFEYGSDQLAEAARLSLMKLGILIQKNPDSDFIVEGHTDSFGSDDYNLSLSLRRAQAVVGWLQASLRLETDRVRAVGMGEAHPLSSTSGTVEEQSLNRRVEIKVRPRR